MNECPENTSVQARKAARIIKRAVLLLKTEHGVNSEAVVSAVFGVALEELILSEGSQDTAKYLQVVAKQIAANENDPVH